MNKTRSQQGRASRSKGIRFENEIAKLLAERTGLPIRRTLDQTRASGHDIPCGGFSIQAKHRRSMSLPSWWRQTVAEAPAGMAPVLVVKRHRGGVMWWFRIVDLDNAIVGRYEVVEVMGGADDVVGVDQATAIRAIAQTLRKASA